MLKRSVWVVCGVMLAAGCSARGGGSTTVVEEDAGNTRTDTGSVSTDTGSTVNPTDTGNPDPPPDCPAPRVVCGRACVDARSDNNHCGGCGIVCTDGAVCQSAQCVTMGPSCDAPRTRCDGACIDPRTSPTHCGVCNRACAGGQSCVNGTCTAPPSCTAPQVLCNNGCTNPLTDARNCGVCGLACASDERCTNGVCTRGTPPPTDAGMPPTGNAVAGRACASDPTVCGSALTCFGDIGSGHCSARCTNGSATSEATQCGGAGGTCVQLVSPNPSGTTQDERTGFAYCAQQCDPQAPAGTSLACRAGMVCTRGWLRNTTYMTETAGCIPHCTSDAQCAGAVTADAQGMGVPAPFCEVRVGSCRPARPNIDSLRADGQPCNPQTERTTRQCRGLCLPVNAQSPTQGLCGSIINLGVTTSCPDDATNVLPRAPMGDNLALCVYRDCTATSQCGTGLICRYPESNGQVRTDLDRSCDYPTAAQPR